MDAKQYFPTREEAQEIINRMVGYLDLEVVEINLDDETVYAISDGDEDYMRYLRESGIVN